ncbi:MAG: hypothetical protein ACKPKO_60360, partial [Candidatus Fonsibacter sp.]
MGPIALYRQITTETLYIISADSLKYTTSKTVWANLAAGVPLQPRKTLKKLCLENSQGDLVLAVEEFNMTVSEENLIKSIAFYSTKEETMITLWSSDRRDQAIMSMY